MAFGAGLSHIIRPVHSSRMRPSAAEHIALAGVVDDTGGVEAAAPRPAGLSLTVRRPMESSRARFAPFLTRSLGMCWENALDLRLKIRAPRRARAHLRGDYGLRGECDAYHRVLRKTGHRAGRATIQLALEDVSDAQISTKSMHGTLDDSQ